ncbi:helix-turn-helix domain-containing protein [Altererythrobacter sp. GH1-8]|uniref:helix-turn-helix domain-containing protein n=1 Tax=Altererythrobacter sp. GH1-8 TaxID=3349333 RepID=UPI00374DFBD5
MQRHPHITNAPTSLMSVADFCSRYKIGKTSLYREAAAGRLKLRKFGSATRIAIEDAEAWAANLPIVDGGANEAA